MPTSNTFKQESEKAKDKFSSAIGWSIFLAIYTYLIFVLEGYALDTLMIFIASLVIFPLVIVLVPSATNFILQRVFHRKQYLYDKVLYLFTAILVLFQLIINPLTFINSPDVESALNYVLIAYQVILFAIAIKAISNIKYWQAIVTALFSALIAAILFICAVPILFSLMGGVTQTLR